MSNSSSSTSPPSESNTSPPPPDSSSTQSPPPPSDQSPPSPTESSSQPPPASSSDSPPSPPSQSENSPPSSGSSPGSSSQTPPNNNNDNNAGGSSDTPSRDDGSRSPPNDWYEGLNTPSKNHPKLRDRGNRDSGSDSKDSNGSLGSGVIIGLSLVGIIVLLAVIFFVARGKKKKYNGMEKHFIPPTHSTRSEGYQYRQSMPFSGSHKSDPYCVPASPMAHSGPLDPNGSKSWFTYEELADATHGFSRENVLGEGGFGCVFKGWLQDGRCVAVKQLKAGSGQGEREFQAEVEIISRVHHRHLVSLVGYCIAEYHRLLVYEFVPNGTLEHHLHGKGVPVMDWSKRMRIAIGSARGLAYLHEDCHPRIIHRDIKSANILLDNAFEAQVADFGLAKPSNDSNTHVSTRIMGTFGYLAPEYASSGKLTDRSDVFSFGVVLLEMITGRKPVDPTRPLGDESLVEWSRPLLAHALETRDFGEVVDPRLDGNFEKNEMFKMIEVAAACTRHSAPKRPRMVQVARTLDSVGDGIDLSNGVKYGHSTVYDSDKYSADIQRFRKMALSDDDYSNEYGQSSNISQRGTAYSGETYSRDGQPLRPPPHPSQFGIHYEESNARSESETRPMNYRAGDTNENYRYGGRGYS